MQKFFAGVSHFAQLTFIVDWDSETSILAPIFPVNIDFPSENAQNEVIPFFPLKCIQRKHIE